MSARRFRASTQGRASSAPSGRSAARPSAVAAPARIATAVPESAAEDDPTGTAAGGLTVDDLPGGVRRWLASERAAFGITMAVLAAIAMAALGYLAIAKLTNSTAVCFVVQGCDTVAASKYSTFMGVPVAVYGLGMATIVLVSVLAWWRTGDGRILYLPYALGLIGVFVIATLVYLELFVIHAICIWCTIAGISIILGWIVSVITVRRFGATR